MAPSKDIIFPPFRLDLAGQQLHRGERLISLRPKAFAVLQHLLSYPGQLINKTELLDAVWPETAISDTVLKVCIREIREALGDDAEVPRFVETVHRKGYRFIGFIRTSNLPAPLTSFVGRERETADLKRLLQGDVRLLTLTGAGGSGKTRLATQVAQESIAQHAVEVWWVDLSPLTEESLVPQAITSALAIHDHAGKEPIETLCDYLRSRRLTLVLDNCEHVLKTAASVVKTLLQTCGQLTIVATSRERLGINGELEFPLSPMTLPDNPREESVDQLLKSDAIRLFAVRAVAASSRFELTHQNAGFVVELCQRLDGIPLAIELAAARLKVLTVEQLLARLDNCLALLASTGRSESPRHQTLRATIDWSYNLLSEQERALQRRLSLFAGDWTLEAAEEVCAGDGISLSEVLDLISHLIDKSLVLMREDQGQARYRLLESIRQYNLEKLDEAKETECITRRHTAYYLQLAETIAPRINTADRQHSLIQLAADYDNMRAALRYAEHGEVETSLRLCDALFFFWFYRGYWSEGRSWLGDVLSRSNDSSMSDLRGRAMRADGVLASFMGDHSVALARLEESASIHRQTGDLRSLAAAIVFLSYELLKNDPERALALVEEGIDLSRQTGDRFVLAMSLNHSAAVAFVRKDYPAAHIRYAEAAALGRELKDSLPIGSSLRGLGHVAIRQRQYELAASHLTESLLALRSIGDKWFVSRTLDTIAEMHSAQGDHDRAARLLGASAAAQEAVGASMFEFYRDEYEGLIRMVREALGEETFNTAWTEGRVLPLHETIEYALSGMARR